MVAYTKEEMVGVTELSRSLGKYLDKVIAHPLNKIAIIRRNEPEAVIVPIEEYEHMKAASEYLENLEIAKVIEERVENRKTPLETISLKDLLVELRKDGRNV